MSLEDAWNNAVHPSVGSRTVNTGDFDTVTRLQFLNQIVLQNYLNRARKLAWRSHLGHLLDSYELGIFVDAVAILSGEFVSLSILGWKCGTSTAGIVVFFLSKVSQICVILEVYDKTLLGCFTIVD